MVINLVQIDLVAANTDHYGSDQAHRKIMRGALATYCHRCHQAYDADNGANIEQVTAQYITQGEIRIAIQRRADIDCQLRHGCAESNDGTAYDYGGYIVALGDGGAAIHQQPRTIDCSQQPH